jgi:hypothetical protein
MSQQTWPFRNEQQTTKPKRGKGNINVSGRAQHLASICSMSIPEDKFNILYTEQQTYNEQKPQQSMKGSQQ